MERSVRIVVVTLAAAAVSAVVFAGASVWSAAQLEWTDAGIPGVSKAVVAGDMATAASRFYWKYKAGFIAPDHHHTSDHIVTTVSGTLVLVVDGKEHRLEPGSYFSLSEKQPHATRCEGSVDCVMFIEAQGPWDVVIEEAKP
jgi:quercetin dioxygenase-like cupin family protein